MDGVALLKYLGKCLLKKKTYFNYEKGKFYYNVFMTPPKAEFESVTKRVSYSVVYMQKRTNIALIQTNLIVFAGSGMRNATTSTPIFVAYFTANCVTSV